MRDPYEMEHVVVPSCKDNCKGEGLFTRKYVPANTILTFYNGVKLKGKDCIKSYTWEEDAYKIMDLEGKDCIKSDTWEEDAYKIMDLLESEETESGILNIPAEYQDTQHYCAPLAHQANHSFKPNAKLTLFSHQGFLPCYIFLQKIIISCRYLVKLFAF